MLMQSHEGYINLLPTLPDKWKNGSFKGLKARGNFTVDCRFADGIPEEITLTSCAGGEVTLRFAGIGEAKIFEGDKEIEALRRDGLTLTFATEKGKSYYITGIRKSSLPDSPKGLVAERKGNTAALRWQGEKGLCFRVYVARNSDPCYTLLAETEKTELIHTLPDENAVYSYRVVAFSQTDPTKESRGALATVDPSDELLRDRYKRHCEQIYR
jgi:hypothetical protein